MDSNANDRSNVGTAAAPAVDKQTQHSGESAGPSFYAVEGSNNTLQFGHWTMPPPGAKVIKTRDELFEACSNYTKSDILEALVGLLKI